MDTERESVKGRLKGGQVKRGKERTRGVDRRAFE